MKQAVKILFTKDTGAVEDAAGLVSLFLVVFAVLSLPGLA